MRSIRFVPGLFWLLAVLACSTILRGQSQSHLRAGFFHTDRFTVVPVDTVLHLTHQFILPGTEMVVLDSLLVTGSGLVEIDYRFGTLRLSWDSLAQFISESQPAHILTIGYQYLPFTFKDSYQRHEPVVRIDSVTGQSVTVARPVTRFSFDELFGSNIQKSGSIIRGLSIGTNRDLSLNSGFRMQMTGKLTKDIDVIAALTDENTPIQPEGTTRTLQEVDKVFIELRGTNASATLGDFHLILEEGEFGKLNRKVQGGKGTALLRTGDVQGDFLVAGALARGKFTTNQLQGIDGVQGPYRLTGRNGEREIIVIAGTERVYVNGERMVRGEVHDYVIDYGIGEVVFTPRRLITRSSRISIDFEYTDRRYNRNLLAAKGGGELFGKRATVSAMVIREGDDENSPVDLSLNDSDKTVLRLAGSDRQKATRSGIHYVGPGKGRYVQRERVETLPDGSDTLVTYYQFLPTDTLNAVYSITFEYVGEGSGDYERVVPGQYQYAGLRRGRYAPIRFLPLPDALTLTDLRFAIRPAQDLKISTEFALSDLDANRFATPAESRSTGGALNLGMEYYPTEIRIGNHRLGTAELIARHRRIDSKFTSPERFNDVEFGRKWNVTYGSRADETISEGTLTYRPTDSLAVGGEIGQLNHGGIFTSSRYTGLFQYQGDNLPSAHYQLEFIRNHDENLGVGGRWTRHHGTILKTLGPVRPTFTYNGEILHNRVITSEALQSSSFKYNEIQPSLTSDEAWGMSFRAAYGWRWEDSLASMGGLQRAFNQFTQQYGWYLREWHSITSTLDLTILRKRLEQPFDEKNSRLTETILLRSQTRYGPPSRGVESDLFYELGTGRSAKLERVYQRVPRGMGNYEYIGDVNENRILDDADFRLTRFDGDFIAVNVPGELLVPVVDVKASGRLRINGDRLIPASGWIGAIIRTLSSETYLRVEEKTTESMKRRIYFLQLQHFLNEASTIQGSNLVTQDFYFWENRRELSLRFRFTQRNGLSQFAAASERVYNAERSARVKWQLIDEVANQTDFIEKRDNLSSSGLSNRVRAVVSNTITTDWTYRPEQSVEVGFRFLVGRSTDFDTTQADLNDQSVRVAYAFQGRGQARVELTREEVILHRQPLFVPYELTVGKVMGLSWLWRVGLDYRITESIQGSLIYDGRTENRSQPIHTARAEVRAFF